MNDTISRQAAIKDAESWVAIDEHEKHLQKNVIEWLKGFPAAELGTNLAEVGTDCISRQAATDALECINGVEEVLRSLPPAQPVRMRARWEDAHRSKWDGTFYWFIKCNNCGYVRKDDDHVLDAEYKFCPNCGADMREVTT